MASAMYQLGVKEFLDADVDLLVDTIRVIFLRTSVYTFAQAHDFFNDLTSPVGNSGNSGVGDGGQLGTPTTNSPVGGVFDALDETLTSVSSGAALNALAIYKDTGSAATSPLLAYVDGFSVTPNGGNIQIQWDSGTSRIFRLVA